MDEQSQAAIRDSVTEASNQALATASEALRFHPWITQELFDETRRVWSKAYGRIITDDEVIEILANVRRLAARQPNKESSMNVVIWARVSSREQREGYSIDAQLRANRERAERAGWHVVREFVVAESAKRGAERTGRSTRCLSG